MFGREGVTSSASERPHPTHPHWDRDAGVTGDNRVGQGCHMGERVRERGRGGERGFLEANDVEPRRVTGMGRVKRHSKSRGMG